MYIFDLDVIKNNGTQFDKMERYFGGIKSMTSLPDIVVLVGQIHDLTAVKECLKLGIPLITILDTNCDPGLSNFVIPANDDSISSISLIMNQITRSIKGEINLINFINYSKMFLGI